MTNEFEFLDPGKLIDDDLRLIMLSRYRGTSDFKYVPAYKFKMVHVERPLEEIGRIDLRIGFTNDLVMYSGHIGYGVNELYRGHRYAARSCVLLFNLARRHGINPLWITCNPDNYASRRTCEIAGGKLIEIVDLPFLNEMYMRGERQKCRYRFDI